jgi:3-isopropylmalate/(R)-2-methylmalate dehydratase small subunit
MGFPLVTCPGILGLTARSDMLEVDWAAAAVRHPASGRALPLQPLAESERQTLEAGGLLPYLKARRSRAQGVHP